MSCPVRVFTTPSVPAEQLGETECWLCGEPLSEHPARVAGGIPSGRAFAVNPAKVVRQDLRSGEITYPFLDFLRGNADG